MTDPEALIEMLGAEVSRVIDADLMRNGALHAGMCSNCEERVDAIGAAAIRAVRAELDRQGWQCMPKVPDQDTQLAAQDDIARGGPGAAHWGRLSMASAAPKLGGVMLFLWGKYPPGRQINLWDSLYHNITHVYGIVGKNWFFGVQRTSNIVDNLAAYWEKCRKKLVEEE